jgi:thioredoxin 2
MLIVCPHCLKTNRVPEARTAEDPTCGHCHRALLAPTPVALDDASFETVVSRTGLPIVVDFWAEWCGPCHAMAPQFEQVAARLKGKAMFAKVDSDRSPQTSARFGIRSIPTLLLLRDGREVKRQAGAVQAAQIVGWLARDLEPA